MQKSIQVSSKLDRTESMQNFLQELKIITELTKGVQSMKSFIYPTVLQKKAMPEVKSNKKKNIIIHY